MKKLTTCLLTSCLALTLATGALAEQINVFDKEQQQVKSVVFPVGKSQYFVNGQAPGVTMDATTYISSQGRTFVPVRYLGNALGVDNDHIKWDNQASKATLSLGSNSAELTVGQKQIVVNGKTQTVDAAPELNQGRTYLPARFVAEALGYDVDFVSGLVVCWPKGADKPVEDILAIQQVIGQQPEQGQQGTVDVAQVGKPVAGQLWAEWVKPLNGPSKYTTVTPADLKAADFQLDKYDTVKDIVINKDTIEVTLKTTSPIQQVLLIDNENRIRFREAGSNSPADNRKFVFRVVDNDYDDINNYPTAEISKIKSIIVGTVGNILEVSNPYYGGGK